MMRSLMMNQNNSIINAFILWKTNIDKELEGIEECINPLYFICFRSYLLLCDSFKYKGVAKISMQDMQKEVSFFLH